MGWAPQSCSGHVTLGGPLDSQAEVWEAADYESGARKSELGWRHPLGLALRWD